jgi:hypothetical protein
MGTNDPGWAALGSSAAYDIGEGGATVPLQNGNHNWEGTNNFYGAGTYFGNNYFTGNNTFGVSQISNTGAFDLYGWIFTRGVALTTSAIIMDNVGGPVSVADRLQLRFTYNSLPIGQIKCNLSSFGNGETIYQNLSDGRFKHGVTPLVSGDVIDQLNPIRYRLGSDDDLERIGFSAQELYEAVPQAATPGKGEPGEEGFIPWMRSMGALEPVVVAELKALRRRVAELEARVAA